MQLGTLAHPAGEGGCCVRLQWGRCGWSCGRHEREGGSIRPAGEVSTRCLDIAPTESQECCGHMAQENSGIIGGWQALCPRLVNDELSVVAEVPPGDIAKVELSSGENGLFSRRFVESEEDRTKQRIVPLEPQHDRLAALRIAKSKGVLALGVVPTRRGWGIRVLAESFQAVLADINPAEQAELLGDAYLVSGLPLSWGSANVKEFLGAWAARPVGRPIRVGFTNTWTVKAEQPPPATKLRNGDPLGLNVIGIVSKKEFRTKPNRVVLQMKPCSQSHGQKQ